MFLWFLFGALISNCVAVNNTETRLRDYIFTNYNSQNRPVLNYSDSVTSSFGVELMSLEEFDQVGEKVKFNFHMKFTWYDEFLRWNLSEYNFKYLNINPEFLWRPDLELYNSANKPEKINGEGILKVFHTGQVYWVIPVLYDYSCPLSLGSFPFDTQKCIMTFGSWKLSQNYLNISTHELPVPKAILNSYTHEEIRNNISSKLLFPPVAYDKFQHNEWTIKQMIHLNENLEYLCCPGELWTISEIDIVMERKYHKYMVVIIMTFFLTCSSLTVSLFTLEKYIRTYLLVFIPLSIIWLQLYISSKIPVIEYATTMENFIQLSFYVCMVSAIYSGIIYNISKKKCKVVKTRANPYLTSKWLGKNVMIQKSHNQGNQIYLDYGYYSRLLYNLDNLFRGILFLIYIILTIVFLSS